MHCHLIWIRSFWWSQNPAWKWAFLRNLRIKLQYRHESCWPRWRRLSTVFVHSLSRNRVQQSLLCVPRHCMAKGVHRRHLCRPAETPAVIPRAAPSQVSVNCSRPSKIMSCEPAAVAAAAAAAAATKLTRMRSWVALKKLVFDVREAAFRSQLIQVFA